MRKYIGSLKKTEGIRHNLDPPLDVRKSDYGWDSNPCPQQPQTYIGFEVAAVFQRRTRVRPPASIAMC